MKKSLQRIAAAILFLLVISGCSMQSEEEAIKSAKEAADKVFSSKQEIKTNYTLDSFSMYLPNGLEVKEADASNAILEDGDQTFIVFFNSLENTLSKISYKAAAAKKDEALLLDTFKDKEKFGYIRILPHNEDNKYELQIGVGGVKITTYTSKGELDNDSEDIMKIAHSIAFQHTNTVQK
ncbi:hypothetical protein ACFO3D_00745 [Virgibacillus kekensis]|uniref:Lipoprotein n=1 Tax=Virgibacillus kekensis TaxID=202261 RepID=A0ABV9DFB2_9BACI